MRGMKDTGFQSARPCRRNVLHGYAEHVPRIAHPDFGRAAALQILAMVPPCLRFAPCGPSRTQARAGAERVQRSHNPTLWETSMETFREL